MGYECHKYHLRPYASNLMLQFLTCLTCAELYLFEGLGTLCQRWKRVSMLCIQFALAGIQVLTAQSRLIPASCATFTHLAIQPSPAPLWNMIDSVDAMGPLLLGQDSVSSPGHHLSGGLMIGCKLQSQLAMRSTTHCLPLQSAFGRTRQHGKLSLGNPPGSLSSHNSRLEFPALAGQSQSSRGQAAIKPSSPGIACRNNPIIRLTALPRLECIIPPSALPCK